MFSKLIIRLLVECCDELWFLAGMELHKPSQCISLNSFLKVHRNILPIRRIHF